MSKERFVYAKAANGLTVRIPADKYGQWQKAQQAGAKPDPKMREALLRKLAGK